MDATFALIAIDYRIFVLLYGRLTVRRPSQRRQLAASPFFYYYCSTVLINGAEAGRAPLWEYAETMARAGAKTPILLAIRAYSNGKSSALGTGRLDQFLSLFQCLTCPRISYVLARDH
jgi:hypothetical protein